MYACKTPRAVYAGSGALNQLPALLGGAKEVAVFSDRGVEQSGVLALPLKLLEDAGIRYTLLTGLPPEPTYQQAQATVDAFRAAGAQAIVAVGGGSVMDIAKLCSILDGDVTVKALLDDPSLGRRVMPTVMIPTTAGTGAEATPNAIVAVPEKEL